MQILLWIWKKYNDARVVTYHVALQMNLTLFVVLCDDRVLPFFTSRTCTTELNLYKGFVRYASAFSFQRKVLREALNVSSC